MESAKPVQSAKVPARLVWLALPVLALLLFTGQSAFSQGLLNLGTGLAPNNANYGYIFQIQATNPVIVYRIGAQLYNTSGTVNVDLWKRPDGHNNGQPDGNWVQVGTSSTTFSAGTVTQIPIDINQIVTAGQYYGFCLIFTGSTIGYANGPNPNVSDANITITTDGYGKAVSAGSTPPVAAGSNYPRSFCGTVFYDLAGIDISSPAPGPLTIATEGQTGYNETFECIGGNPPFTWSLTGAPPWLTFTPTAGAQVQLTAATVGPAGSYTFDVTATDNTGNDATETYTLDVNAPPTLSLLALDPLTETGTYPAPFVVPLSGGTGPFTWTMTGAPAGVTLSASGELQGPPDAGTAAGSPYPVTITVEDANGVSDDLGPLDLVVNPLPVITTAALAEGAVGFPYSETIAVTGGSMPFTWSITGTVGPFSIDPGTGEITGTPATIGTFTFDVELVDACGITDLVNLSILVQDPPLIVPVTLPTLTETITMTPSVVFTAAGGDETAYVWTAPGSVPNGMIFTQQTQGGVEVYQFSGTPAVGSAGSYPMTIQVEDPTTGLTDTFSVTLDINQPPQIDTTAVPPALATATTTCAYTVTFQAVAGKGTAPMTWALGTVTGPDVALPGFMFAGGTLSAASVGTPTGTYEFEVTLTDANGAMTLSTYTLVINPVVDLEPLVDGTVGEIYSHTITVVPNTGVGPYTFAVVTPFPGTLGLTVDVSGATPVITGTPAGGFEGEQTIVFNVTDANGVSRLVTMSMMINAALNQGSSCCGAVSGSPSPSAGWLLLLLMGLTPLLLRLRRSA